MGSRHPFLIPHVSRLVESAPERLRIRAFRGMHDPSGDTR